MVFRPVPVEAPKKLGKVLRGKCIVRVHNGGKEIGAVGRPGTSSSPKVLRHKQTSGKKGEQASTIGPGGKKRGKKSSSTMVREESLPRCEATTTTKGREKRRGPTRKKARTLLGGVLFTFTTATFTWRRRGGGGRGVGKDQGDANPKTKKRGPILTKKI